MWRPLVAVVGLLVAVHLIVGATHYFFTRDDSPVRPPPTPVMEYEHFERTANGKAICPKCGRSHTVLWYQYGLTKEAPPAGFVNGGCVMNENSPEYWCSRCGTSFGKKFRGPDKAAE